MLFKCVVGGCDNLQKRERKLCSATLRTFATKFSNIDIFLKILPLKDDELVMSEGKRPWERAWSEV